MSNTHQNTLEALYSKRDDLHQEAMEIQADYAKGRCAEDYMQHVLRMIQTKALRVETAITVVQGL